MISSQLQAQLFPKNLVWQILAARRKVWGKNPVPIDLEVSIGDKFVGVYLPPSTFKYKFKVSRLTLLGDATLYFYLHLIAKYNLAQRNTTPQGFCTMISFWDFLEAFMMRSQAKAQIVSVFQARKNIFSVTSSQGQEAEPHTVNFTLWSASCSCMLFKCLRNRIAAEAPYYHQLMKESRYFAGQAICHHIEAALNYQGFTTLEGYLLSRQRSSA